MSQDNTNTKYIAGEVSSDKMDKTIVVKVLRKVRHKLYKKYITKTTTYHVSDVDEVAKIGDKVLITPCAPVSKTVKWKLVEVVK